MLGFVSKFVGERDGAPEERDEADPGGRRPPARLYECPDCESIYLALDLETCGSCDVDVDRIPTERDLAYGSARSP